MSVLLPCSVLRSVLPDKGYTAHVLVHSASALFYCMLILVLYVRGLFPAVCCAQSCLTRATPRVSVHDPHLYNPLSLCACAVHVCPVPCSVLRSVLPDKGYTAHVLGYTAAALLEAHVKAGVAPGQLDDCVEPLLPTLEGDLFGEVRGHATSLPCTASSWRLLCASALLALALPSLFLVHCAVCPYILMLS